MVFGAIHIPGDPTVGQADQFFANPELEPQTGQVIESDRNSLEQRFVTPLLQVSGSGEKTVFFLTGHGERNSVSPTEENGYLLAAELLRSEGYGVETLDLQTKTLVPRQTGETQDEPLNENEVAPTLIVVAGPQKNLLPDEEEVLSQYIKDGGRMLLLLDPETPDSFRAFLKKWGLSLGKGNIIDQEEFIGEERTPFISQYNPDVPLTQTLGRTFFPGVTSHNIPPRKSLAFKIEGQEIPLVQFTVLAATSSNSWLIEDPNRTEPDEDIDTRGPLFTAVLADAYGTKGAIGEEIPENREDLDKASLVIIGDSDFASNEHFDSAGNGDLFLNSANFLVGDVSLINIRPRLQSRPELLATPQRVQRHSLHELVPAADPDGDGWDLRVVDAPIMSKTAVISRRLSDL